MKLAVRSHTLSSIIVFGITILNSYDSVKAENRGFMPGDAFFHSILTEDEFKSFSDNEIHLKYRGVPNTGAGCGSVGFQNLKISGDTSGVAQSLRRLHKSLREFHPKIIQVRNDGSKMILNGFHLFVYNVDIKGKDGFSDQRLGLRYNESWNNIPESAFQSETRKPIRGFNGKEIPAPRIGSYTTFVKHPDAIIHDWQFSRKFRGLDVNVPNGVGWGIPGKPINQAVTIDVQKIQLIVIPEEEDLRKFFQRRKWKEFYSVTTSGIVWNRFTKCKEVESMPWTEKAAWPDPLFDLEQ